jgi:hypothetical protein
MSILDRERRHYRCPECASRNVRLVATLLVNISDQPASAHHFDHHLDVFANQITDAWYIKPFAFVCEECDYESSSWHRNADALKTAFEWSEVVE